VTRGALGRILRLLFPSQDERSHPAGDANKGLEQVVVLDPMRERDEDVPLQDDMLQRKEID
jgi:hypothetical protein